jgi:hypothetical protein
VQPPEVHAVEMSALNPNLMRQNQKRVAGAIEFLRLTPYEGPYLRFA